MNSVRLLELGERDYLEVWSIQKRIVEMRGRGEGNDTLIVVEHPEVITLGRRFSGETPPGAIAIERGGEATLHNLGQLVFYPILRLEGKERDVRAYVRGIEEVVIQALDCFGIRGERKIGATGVWLDKGQRKIASIGVAISRWVTYHGVAINVNNDLKPFERINPCGFEASVMTSMARELGGGVDRAGVIQEFCRLFREVFRREPHCAPDEELLSLMSWESHGEVSRAPRAG